MIANSARWTDSHLSRGARRFLIALAVVGVATLVVGAAMAPQRVAANLLLISMYLVGIGVGAAFFISLQYLSGASWAVALRRVPEALCMALIPGAVGIGLVLLVWPTLYPWFRPTPELAPHITGFKSFWLSRPFFLARSAIYLLLWIALALALVRNSRRQDIDGDVDCTRRNVRLSAVFMVVFAASFWLASFDWIMSLEPEWYSTIFGVYNFAGSFLSVVALMTVLAIWLQRRGPLRNILTEEHLHDLGKLLFAFSTFWMYIWFSQYMLIWYANIPEETVYFVRRLRGAWAPLLVLNLVLNWVLPFFALLSRRAKRSPALMLKVAGVVLVGRWLDLYLMIMPAVAGPTPPFGAWEAGLAAGGVAGLLLVFSWALGSAPPVPMNDPLVRESLCYHQ